MAEALAHVQLKASHVLETAGLAAPDPRCPLRLVPVPASGVDLAQGALVVGRHTRRIVSHEVPVGTRLVSPGTREGNVGVRHPDLPVQTPERIPGHVSVGAVGPPLFTEELKQVGHFRIQTRRKVEGGPVRDGMGDPEARAELGRPLRVDRGHIHVLDEPAVLRRLKLRHIVKLVVRVKRVEPDARVHHHALELHLVLQIKSDLKGVDGGFHVGQIAGVGDEVDDPLAGVGCIVVQIVDAETGQIHTRLDEVPLGDLRRHVQLEVQPAPVGNGVIRDIVGLHVEPAVEVLFAEYR